MAKTEKKEVDNEKPMKPKSAYETYSETEKKFYKRIVKDLLAARELQNTKLTEYDDATYLSQYEANRKADLAYNEPLTDENDIAKVNTGLTREKDTTILSTLINFNFQPNITAFDKDNSIINDLGNQMEDMVKKSRGIEVYDGAKRQSIYRELISQGSVYVEEVYTEKKIVSKYDTEWSPKMKISEYKGDDKPIFDIEGKCEAELHLGKYVLTSSMNEQDIQNNTLVATYKEIDRSLAQSIYGEWDRWEYVPEQVDNTSQDIFNSGINNGSDFNWNVWKVAKGKVGVLKVYLRYENRYMILLNGVMVLPIDFPLTKRSPSGLIPIAKGIGEVIPNFRDGKGIPSKTKVDQKLYDTLLRAMAGKAWQSFKPALGNKSGNALGANVMKAGQITSGIKQNDIFPILPRELLGINTGDVSFFQLAKEVINEKSITDSYSGQNTEANTATEVLNQKKQTMLKLTAFIDGVKELEKRMVFLRIYNIIANWTKSQDSVLQTEIKEMIDGVEVATKKYRQVKKYNKYSVDTSIEGEKKGTKIIQFHNDNEALPTVREQIEAEDKMSEQMQKPVRMAFLNAEWLRMLPAIWYIQMVVASENDDNMQLIIFIDNLTKIASLFGVQVFKAEYVLQRIANKMSEDFDKMFQIQTGFTMDQLTEQMGLKSNVNNPAEQVVNSNKPSPLTVAKAQ